MKDTHGKPTRVTVYFTQASCDKAYEGTEEGLQGLIR